MEVVVPVQDFHFASSPSTPFVSAPSSPRVHAGHNHHYTSAPTSPTRSAAIYDLFNTLSISTSSATAGIPFLWEETPGTPKSPCSPAADDDFAFDFSGQMEKGRLPPELAAADELFESGRIRPLKPPLKPPPFIAVSPPRSDKKKEFDPFEAAMREVTRDRGRERSSPFSSSISHSRSRKGSRSLSPFNRNSPASPAPAAATPKSSGGGGGWGKRWRLRDLFLFRSASEGRATGNRSKDPLRKYSLLPDLASPDSKSSSFRSTDSSESVRRGSRTPVSAHERHYTAKRAAAEEMKKKTALPYRQGLFGCLRFNPAVNSIYRGSGLQQLLFQRRPSMMESKFKVSNA